MPPSSERHTPVPVAAPVSEAALAERELVLAAQAGDSTAALLVEGAALHLEADLKWLDLCEQRLGADR